jgi:hypothetical protein
MARSRIHDLVRGGVTGAQWLEGLTPGTLAYQQAEERFLTGEVGRSRRSYWRTKTTPSRWKR